MFYDLDHAKMRIEGCVLTYKNRLIFVTDVDETGRNGIFKLWYIKLEDIKAIDDAAPVSVLSNNNDLSLEPIPLGNINFKGECKYISRMPGRQWKQGLNGNNVLAYEPGRGWRPFDIQTPALMHMFENKYPNIHEAIQRVCNDEVRSMAFSRNFSYDGGGRVMFKCRTPIGQALQDGKVVLNRGYDWIREHLEEEAGVQTC